MRASIWDTDGGVYFGQRYDPKDTPEEKELLREKSRLDIPGRITTAQHRYVGKVVNGAFVEADRHIVTLGPNGSGKTQRLLVPNLAMLTGWSCVVVDPKGELAVQTAAHRLAAGNEIITLDPFGVIARQYPHLVENLKDASGRCVLKSAGLNPMAALDPDSDDFPDDAKAIGEALVKVESQNEAYWAKSGQALLAGLAMGLRFKFGTGENLGNLRRHVGEAPENLAKFISERLLTDLPENQAAIRSKLARFTKVNAENRELMGILSTVQTHTDWLDSRSIAKDLSRGEPYDFGVLKNRPVTVYLILPPRYLESHATWLRLMLTAILLPLLRTLGGKVPVLFMLDEFAALGRLQVIEQNMAMMRGFGVKLWTIFQDLSQAKDIYERRWESFISNAGVRQAFAPQDVTTQEYLSKLSGQRMYWLETTGTNTGQSMGPQSSMSSGVTKGWTNFQGPVYWPQGLAAMENGKAVLFGREGPVRTWLPYPTEIPLTRDMLERAAAAAR